MNLLIVESPGKIKTIKKYLPSGWDVKASVGHICDLPKGSLGVNKQDGFKAIYEVNSDKKSVVKLLSDAILNVGKNNVYLATDEDREGEAISYHLCRVLGLDFRTTKRVTFNEITEKAINAAIISPRKINIPLVAAQEARRVVDRLVGYEVSPILWKKIESATTLSAGRVQSVAVKLVVEREREIVSFEPRSMFKVGVNFLLKSGAILKAESKRDFLDATSVREYLLSISKKIFVIKDIKEEPKKINPQAPFSTSTLQQDANKKLKLSVDATMKIAQSLYEAGYITYMRTDSVNLSDTAIEKVSSFILKEFGEKYLSVRKFKNRNESAQEAHEAIRPTDFNIVNIDGSSEEVSLYSLIYNRSVASQMSAKEVLITTVSIDSTDGNDPFAAKASVVLFDGYTRAYQDAIQEGDDDDGSSGDELSVKVSVGELMSVIDSQARQAFTRPKQRYSEADLVKQLEHLGIGRPATYASIIATIKNKRKYVVVSKVKGKIYSGVIITCKDGRTETTPYQVELGGSTGRLMPSTIGATLVDYLQKEFSLFMRYDFTAQCEEKFDAIMEGKFSYKEVVTNFYSDLEKSISSAVVASKDVLQAERKTTVIGHYNNKNIAVGKTDRGPYLLYNEKFYSIPSVDGLNLETAIRYINDDKVLQNKKSSEIANNILVKDGKYFAYREGDRIFISNGIGKDRAPLFKSLHDKVSILTELEMKKIISDYKKWLKSTKKK